MADKLKQWPDDGSTVSFDEIAEPIIDVIKFAYSLERKNKGKSIPYDGYDIGKSIKHVSLSPDESLCADNLSFENDSPLKIIIGIAIQLGIEQGKRIATKEINEKIAIKNLIDRSEGITNG